MAISIFLFQYDHDRISKLSKRLVDTIMANLTHVVRNGDVEHSYPGCVNLSFAYVEGESLLMALKGNYIFLNKFYIGGLITEG